MRSDLVEVTCVLHTSTPLALLMTNLRDEKVWVPKSQCEIEKFKKDYIVLSMPEWLAIQKDLI